MDEENNLSEDYRKFSLNHFENLKKKIDQLRVELNELNKYFKVYFEKAEDSLDNLLFMVEEYIYKLESFNDYKNLNSIIKTFEELIKQFRFCYQLISEIYSNKYINNLNQNNEDINNMINEILELNFRPPNINSFIDFSNSIDLDMSNSGLRKNISEEYEKLKEDIKNSKEGKDNKDSKNSKNENINKIILCSKCYINKATNYCDHCYQLLCDNCYKTISKNEIQEHNFISLENINSKILNKKIYFFNSIQYIIKSLLIKCNYLLNHENIEIIDIKEEKKNDLKKNYFKRKIDYPYIEIKDNESEINFIPKINEILKDYFGISSLNIDSFCISELNQELIKILYNIFYDEKITYFKKTFQDIDKLFTLDFLDENCLDE